MKIGLFWRLLLCILGCSLLALPLSGCFSPYELEALRGELTTLTEENSQLEADLAKAESDLVEARAEVENLQSEYDQLDARYEELNADYQTANDELTQIRSTFPPRDFDSLTELREWLEGNDVSEKPTTLYAEDWYGRALELQEDALMDGYVISVDYDAAEEGMITIWCTAIVGGRLFYWDPETDDVMEEFGLGTVK